MFKAILLTQENKTTRAALSRLDESQLPLGDIDVRIEYSTLNYKDALAVTGRGPVVRNWPMVPGIDLAGVVEASRDPAWTPGERVVVTGWGLGETYWGGLAQKARLSADWLLRLPDAYTTRQSMAIATAGFTAALAVMALRRHGLKPEDGEVLVTGAAGGVGSIAVALLAGLGYHAVASTGRAHEAEYLRVLGARRIVDRAELSRPGKPLQSALGRRDRYGRQSHAGQCLRGHPVERGRGRLRAGAGRGFPRHRDALHPAWRDALRHQQRLLAQHVDPKKLAEMTIEIGLSQVIDYASEVLAGKVRGRTVVDVNE